MIKHQHRHGDVLLTPLDSDGTDISHVLPPAEVTQQNRITLAYGEATGSAHVVVGGIWQWNVSGQRYIRTGPQGATLIQERHGAVLDAPAGHAPQPLAPGTTYIFQPQREATLDDIWQPVMD